MTEIVVDLMTEPAGVPRARAMLQQAQWASLAFSRYDKDSVDRIVSAAARAGAAKAREYAEWAVSETGFGVVEHKALKNVACSTGIVEAYRDHDYVSARFDPTVKILEIPRPAGVVLALTPSTNPVATVFFKALLCLMTRSVVIVSPHPMAKGVCADAARTLADAAVEAGAPEGVIQVVDEPSVPLINALMTDDRTDVIVATGGTAVVRSAYSSGTPAIGVGPGNVPVLVDQTADLALAAKRIVDSKSFDNSVLCTNESVLICEEAARDNLLRHLNREGAYLLADDERDRVRDLVFPNGSFDVRFVGKDAAYIAGEAGVRVAGDTRILLAPFDLVVPEEPLAHEKLCPILGFVTVANAEPRHRRRQVRAPHHRSRALGGHPQLEPEDDHGLQRLGPGAARRRQRRQQPRQLGARDEPGADDDGRDRLLRAVLGGREPAAEAPDAVDPGRVQLRRQRAVRQLRRVHPVGASPRARAPLPAGVESRRRRSGGPGRRPRRPLRRRSGDRPRGDDARSGAPPGGDPSHGSRRARPDREGVTVSELRSFIFLDRLQPQTMSYLGTWVRGSLPRSDVAAQIIEVAPGLDIEPLTDVALKHAEVRAGILVVERQFGYLEIHGTTDEVNAAGASVLEALGATARDATRPQILASKIVTMLDAQHAFLINRNKLGSMALPGESLFVLEMQPASYAILATNEAEKAAQIKVVDYRMIGATGRVYLAGREADVRQAAGAAESALEGLR